MQQNDKQVLFVVEGGDSACAYYRAHLPAQGLRRLGYKVDVCDCLVETETGELTGYDRTKGLTPVPGVVIVRRLNEPIPGTVNDGGVFASNYSMFQRAIDRGQQVYIDLDDDPWTLPDWNPAYGNMTLYELELWQKDMETATGVLCSTPAIAHNVDSHTDAVAHVVRNGIDREDYTYRRVQEGPLRLGWLGTTNYRGRDLAGIRDQLATALDGCFGEVEFWHLGAVEGLPSVRDILGTDFPVQIVERPWVPISELPNSIAQIDCAVIPMVDHPFNRARSNVTGLACCAAGVPFAFPIWHGEYHRLWTLGAGYPAGWVESVRVLTEKAYQATRDDMRAAGLRVAERHNPVETAKQYVEIYRAGLSNIQGDGSDRQKGR